jgi:hypothetical protein
MFISKKDYNELRIKNDILDAKLQGLQKTIPAQAERFAQEKLKSNQVPFPAFCAERLEYWKGKHDNYKKPEPHKVFFTTNDGKTHAKLFNTKEEINEYYNRLKGSSEISITDDYKLHYISIVSYVREYNHPDPYTPEEIESWAKERVEEEMKGWKVVREEVYSPSDEYRKYLYAEYQRRQGIYHENPQEQPHSFFDVIDDTIEAVSRELWG